MEEEKVRNKILLVGSDPSIGKAIVEEILKSEGVVGEEEGECKEDVFSKLLAYRRKWEMRTKYYTSEVFFWVVTTEAAIQMPFIFAEEVEAVILCCSTIQKTLPSFWKSWLTFIKASNPSIQLSLFFNPSSASSPPQTFVSLLEEWSLSNSIEFLLLHSSASPSPPKTQRKSLLREKEGVERLIEALHSHMWPNCKLLSHSTPHSQIHSQVLPQVLPSSTQLNLSPSSHKAQLKQGDNESMKEGRQAQVGRGKERREEEKEEGKEEGKEEEEMLKELFGEFIGGGRGEGEEKELEKQLDSFESTLEKALQMKNYISSLPQQQREKLAANFALQFASLLQDEEGEEGQEK